MTASPRVAVVGAGNMGANHARVVAASPRAELAMVLDVDADRADAVARPLGVEGSATTNASCGKGKRIELSSSGRKMPPLPQRMDSRRWPPSSAALIAEILARPGQSSCLSMTTSGCSATMPCQAR